MQRLPGIFPASTGDPGEGLRQGQNRRQAIREKLLFRQWRRTVPAMRQDAVHEGHQYIDNYKAQSPGLPFPLQYIDHCHFSILLKVYRMIRFDTSNYF